MSANRQAAMEQDEDRIRTQCGGKWLELERQGSGITWKRENGAQGRLELTPAGRLRGSQGEEEMDLAAEAWARELML